MVNIKDIARMANLSISTVSKVINNKTDDLSKETVDKVLKIVKEYNYIPYGKNRNNKTYRTFNIAVILKNLINSSRFITELNKIFRKEGYTLILYDSENSVEYEKSNISKLSSKNIDGLLWEPLMEPTEEIYKNILNQNDYKVLLFNTNDNSKVNFFIDYKKMAYDATQNLIDKGHEKILCFYMDNSVRGLKTLEGYKECILDNNIKKTFIKNFNTNNSNFLDFDFNNITSIISSHYTISKLIEKNLLNNNFIIPYDISLISLRGKSVGVVPRNSISYLEIPYEKFAIFLAKKIINYIETNDLNYDNFTFDAEISTYNSIDVPKNLKEPNILIVGSINLDNMIFLDDFPKAGSVQIANKHLRLAGGKALNQAIGLRRLGKNVRLLGKIGSDEAGDLILSSLKSENVDTKHVIRDKKNSTGVATVMIKNNGESSIFLSGDANNNFKNTEILENEALFINASYTIIQTEIPIDTVNQAIILAKKHKSYTIVKPAAIKALDNKIYKYIDIIVPNRNEAKILSGKDEIEKQAEFFIDKGVKIVIITLDKDGVYLKTKSESAYFKSYDTKVIDETGASDAFISTLVSKLADDYDLKDGIKAGSLSAKYTISNFGVSNTLIDTNTLERYIDLFS